MQTTKFSELNLSKELLKAISEVGFELATPIQAKAIPHLLQNRDVIGQAMTGTGKTAAFAIPAIEKINPKLKKPQVLILCPTRELAVQVAEETGRLLKYKNGIHEVPVYGGQPIERQIRALNHGAQIVIGTPGRVMDHIKRKTLIISNINTIILDEADEMLNMGFIDDIETILKQLPKERQTVLFSATMSKTILKLTEKYQTNPEIVKVTHEVLTVPKIKQEYLEANGRTKLDLLAHLLEVYNPKLSVVFCNTKKMVDILLDALQARGYYADALHGDMAQNKRNRVMERFRKGKSEILIATDVAARGIDVDDVEIVFNYDIPYDEESYVHRIGRTGRAGREGRAITFIYGREKALLRNIEKYTKSKITLGVAPSAEEIKEKKIGSYLEKVSEVVKNKDLAKYISAIESGLTQFSHLDIAAAMLQMHMTKKPSKKETQQTSKSPSRGGRSKGRGSRDRKPGRSRGNGERSGRPKRRYSR